jgi:hypothetical protein
MFLFGYIHHHDIHRAYFKIHKFFMIFITIKLVMCFQCFYEFPDDDTLEIETCSSVECHLLNCVRLKGLIIIVSEPSNSV